MDFAMGECRHPEDRLDEAGQTGEHAAPGFEAGATDWAYLPQGRLALERVAEPRGAAFAELRALLCLDRGYWSQTQFAAMTPEGAAALLGVLPAPARPDQKYLWALRHDGRIVGCLDVVRQWPARHTLSIGFLMIAPSLRGLGLGQAALDELRRRTQGWPGIRRWRVSVVQTQADARAFWRARGFLETGQEHHDPAQRAPQVVMERVVGR